MLGAVFEPWIRWGFWVLLRGIERCIESGRKSRLVRKTLKKLIETVDGPPGTAKVSVPIERPGEKSGRQPKGCGGLFGESEPSETTGAESNGKIREFEEIQKNRKNQLTAEKPLLRLLSR